MAQRLVRDPGQRMRDGRVVELTDGWRVELRAMCVNVRALDAVLDRRPTEGGYAVPATKVFWPAAQLQGLCVSQSRAQVFSLWCIWLLHLFG